MTKALFEGLVFDEADHVLAVAYVGSEPTYVLMEDSFRYHVDARLVDGRVMAGFKEQIDDNPDLMSEGMMKMMGKDDLFTKVAVSAALKNMDKNIAQLHDTGLPEQARQYLGMMGLRIVINRHGEVIDLHMPGGAIDDDGGN